MEDLNEQSIIQKSDSGECNNHDQESLSDFLNHSFKNNFEFHNSKDSTTQGCYEDLMKQVNQAKQTRISLKNQLKQIQEQIIFQALKKLIQEMEILNQQNKQLREEHRKIMKTTVTENLTLQTPRGRRSINSFVGGTSRIIKQKKAIPQFINDSDSKKSQNSIKNSHNVKEKLNFSMRPSIPVGRTSLPLKRPNLYQIQTSKKLTHKMSNSNFSISDISANDLKSQRKKQKDQNEEYHLEDHNIFVQLLHTVVLQEKEYQKQILQQINMIVNYQGQNLVPKLNKGCIMINSLQGKIQQTSMRLQKLDGVLKLYEQQIHQINTNIDDVTVFTRDLLFEKQILIKKQEKCKNRQKIMNQIASKQIILNRKTAASKQRNEQKGKENKQGQIPQSLKAMISVLGGKGKKITSPKDYLDQIKRLIKNPTQFKIQRETKKSKAKHLIENIKVGRIKFKELQEIYINRIHKLNEKINKLYKTK